jgi:hypothetical protein
MIEKAPRMKSKWIRWMARFGFAAKGVMYCAVGGVAARAAFGADEPTGAQGALSRLMELPIGIVIVGLVGLGLAGYAAWRLFRALANPEDDGFGSRAYSLATALVHLVLLAAVLRVLVGERGSSENEAANWTSRALSQPLGRWIVLGIGAGFVGAGLWQVYKAVIAKLDSELNLSRMSDTVHRVTLWVARLGMSARGVVFALVGVSLAVAGWQYDSDEAHGVALVLREISDERYGQVLLAAIAVGFIAYGGYELRRVPTS